MAFLGGAIKGLVGTMFPLLGITNFLAEGFTRIVRVARAIHQGFQNPTSLKDVFENIKKAVFGPLQQPDGKKSGADAKSKSEADLADAMRKLAQAYKDDTYGGGDRARGAIPSAMKGWAFQRAIEGGAYRLGNF